MEEEIQHYITQLKQVFEACDQNGEGFVKTQDLLRLGEEHSNDDGFQVSLFGYCSENIIFWFRKIQVWYLFMICGSCYGKEHSDLCEE